jgi:hypothetical protein
VTNVFRIVGCLLFVVVASPSALASYGLTTSAASPMLRVDVKGNAQVSWAQGGKRQTFIVPKSGAGYHGGLAGADVSGSTRVALPIALVVRKTPDGTLWALQQLDVSGRPASLDFSRWRGAPTQLTLTTDGRRLTGSVTFNGHPVTGLNPTPAGTPVRTYVYIECFGCPAQPNAWILMLGAPPNADGSFAVALRSSWVGRRYRATVAGPNANGEFAPDAQTIINAAP